MAKNSRPASFIDWDLNQANIAAPANAQVNNGHSLNDLLTSAELNYQWYWGSLWQRYLDSFAQETSMASFAVRASAMGGNQVNAFGYANTSSSNSIVPVYVAVGNAGALAISSDGAQWSAQTSGFGANNINAIYAATWMGTPLFIAVGGAGTITTSGTTDGTAWTAQTSNAGGNNLTALASNGSIVVAVGAAGTIVTSANGTTWTAQTSNAGGNNLSSVAYGAGVFVAVGAAGALVSSSNGTTWNARTSQFGATAINYVFYGGTQFVAVGASGKISTSPDGVTWTAQTSNLAATLVWGAYGNGRYVVVQSNNQITTSADGVTWANTTPDGTSSPNTQVAYGDGVFIIASGKPGASNIIRRTGIVSSTDGLNWQPRGGLELGPLGAAVTATTCVAYLGGVWLVGWATGHISSTSPLPNARVLGTITNDSASAGEVGEYVISSVPLASAVTPTTNVAINVTSISLAAGDWDVSGVIWLDGSLTGTVFDGGISTTSATLSTAPTARSQSPTVSTAAAEAYIGIKPSRISLSATTTVYLVARIVFSAGTAKAYGELTARRVR